MSSSLLNIPWYVVSGNHEYHVSVQAILDYSKISARWKSPSRYYSIEKELPNGKDKCLFVFIDTDKSKSERTDMQERVGKILENRKADLYFCGHIHDFQHIKPEGKTVNYIVNSSASSARKVKPIDGTLFCSSDPGITLCSANENNFTFYFINHKGETRYHYTLSK